MKKPLLILALTLAASPVAFAGDAARGKALAEQKCASCHGADGNSQAPAFPRLAGQHADYLAKAITDYQKDKRKDPIMASQAKGLSKADIANLAAYFSGQPGLSIKY